MGEAVDSSSLFRGMRSSHLSDQPSVRTDTGIAELA